jgi:transcriptional regulator with XRE-family HTH domain
MYQEWKKKAIKLRKAGFSYNLILQQIPVSKSTLSYWLNQIPFTPNKEVLERVNSAFLQTSISRQKQSQKISENISREADIAFSSLSERDLLLFGLGLYLGEGAKLLQRVRIINSDPQVIRFAVVWLKEVYKVPISHLSLTIHLYPDCNLSKSLAYWSDISGVPLSQFRKSQIDLRTNKSGKRHRKLPHGTAHLEVNGRGKKELGVQLFRKIMIFIDVFLKKSDKMLPKENQAGLV